jgi:hypothetical protein
MLSEFNNRLGLRVPMKGKQDLNEHQTTLQNIK